MGLFSKIFASNNASTSAATPDNWLVKLLGGGPTNTGVHVTPNTALRIMAVYACVRILSESIGSLPLHLYMKDGKRKEKATDHPLYHLLHDAPNENNTSSEFREMIQAHLGLRGNGFSTIERNGRGVITSLTPYHSDLVTTRKSLKTGGLYYDIQGVDTGIPARRMLHIRGFSLDGVLGLNPIEIARETIGLAVAAENHGAYQLKNGAAPAGLLTYPQKLEKDQRDEVRESWKESQGGVNQGDIAIVSGGVEFKPIGINNSDLQFLETRKFQVTEIARLFRVPPHMIADLDKATFSNIEQQSLDFVIHSLRPWLVRWEQRLNFDLLTKEERKKYFFEFNVDGLLRGDIASRYKSYATGRQWGWLSVNDILQKENSNPIENGDTYLEPLNMTDAAKEKDNEDE